MRVCVCACILCHFNYQTSIYRYAQGILQEKFTTAENGKISDLQTF